MCTSREPKTKGELEAHHGGDAEKGLAIDGGRRTSAEKTSNARVLENKHKQEKTKNNKEKAIKEPKAGKMAAGGVGPVQVGYCHERGVGSSMRWGCMKRKDPATGGESATQIGDDHKQNLRGESLSENPYKPNPQRATNKSRRQLQKKEGKGRKMTRKGQKQKIIIIKGGRSGKKGEEMMHRYQGIK